MTKKSKNFEDKNTFNVDLKKIKEMLGNKTLIIKNIPKKDEKK